MKMGMNGQLDIFQVEEEEMNGRLDIPMLTWYKFKEIRVEILLKMLNI